MAGLNECVDGQTARDGRWTQSLHLLSPLIGPSSSCWVALSVSLEGSCGGRARHGRGTIRPIQTRMSEETNSNWKHRLYIGQMCAIPCREKWCVITRENLRPQTVSSPHPPLNIGSSLRLPLKGNLNLMRTWHEFDFEEDQFYERPKLLIYLMHKSWND